MKRPAWLGQAEVGELLCLGTHVCTPKASCCTRGPLPSAHSGASRAHFSTWRPPFFTQGLHGPVSCHSLPTIPSLEKRPFSDVTVDQTTLSPSPT